MSDNIKEQIDIYDLVICPRCSFKAVYNITQLLIEKEYSPNGSNNNPHCLHCGIIFNIQKEMFT